MIKVGTPPRGVDNYGDGAYGSRRGHRTHRGEDFAAWPGSLVFAVRSGEVTKCGFPYANDLSYRYVEVTDADGLRWRYFYVEPGVEINDRIREGDCIGAVQDIRERYRDMTPHVHLEIKDATGAFIDPKKVLKDDFKNQ